MVFHYQSIQTHGVMTSNGKKVKETVVKVENGKGIKTVSIADHKGIHSDTMSLSNSEVKNIKSHIFMPKLFHRVTKNVMRKKKASTHRISKKGTRKSKK